MGTVPEPGWDVHGTASLFSEVGSLMAMHGWIEKPAIPVLKRIFLGDGRTQTVTRVVEPGLGDRVSVSS